MQLDKFLNNMINKLNLGNYKLEDFMDNEEINKIDTFMEGTDVDKVEGDKDINYQCAIYRRDTGERVFDEVIISINGREYKKTANEDGLYKLSINLGAGTYTITATFNGNDIYNSSSVMNTIIVNPKTDPQPTADKKPIILGCDSNTEKDSAVQNRIAERLKAEGYLVEKLPIGPNFFASTDYSSKSKGHIGIYLIASGIFSIADAAYGSGQFDNYVFGIRGDFGDSGATNFDLPIRADADCTSICDKLNGKTFNQMNAMLEPYVAICGGADSDELADNIINWLNAIKTSDDPEPPVPEETPTIDPEQESRYVKILNYFEDYFGHVEYIDDALEKIENHGYDFYYSDGYNVYTTIERMANYEGVNCYDSSEVFYALALGMNEKYGRTYEVHYLHVYCPVSGVDHIKLLLNNGEVEFSRDPAAVLSSDDYTAQWCGSGRENLIEIDPDFIYYG
jgi:hypothetical protein